MISPSDVTILESPTMMNGELVVGFVVGGNGGQGSPISSTEMEAILEREGPNLARAMSVAVSNVKHQTKFSMNVLSAHNVIRSKSRKEIVATYIY